MRVRLAEPRDLSAWQRMRRALFPDEDFRELNAEAEKFFSDGPLFDLESVLVCENSQGDLIGFLELGLRSYAEGCRSSPVPYVEAWFVEPNVRHTGVGRALIEAAERLSAERGYTEFASDALIENIASIDAHRALGFEEVERAVHFRKRLSRP